MSKVLRLALAYLRQHPVRVVLTSAATVAATCAVVVAASGYDAAIRSFDNFANRALGRYQLSVAPISTWTEQAVPAEAMDALRSDPAVAAVEPMWVRRAPIAVESPGDVLREEGSGRGAGRRGGPGGPGGFGRGPGGLGGPGMPPGGFVPQLAVLGLDSAEPPFAMVRGRWFDPARTEGREAVIGVGAARRLGVGRGGEVLVGQGEHATKLEIVGIVDAPAVAMSDNTALKALSPAVGELFVPMALAEKVHGCSRMASFAGVAVRPGADVHKFRFGWGPRLAGYPVPVQFQEASDIEEALDESSSADQVKLVSYGATGISMLVALLVVFCTLIMGVGERVRQFAILRAVSFSRGQVAALIAIEGLGLATIGFVGGLALAPAALAVMVRIAGRLFHHGAVMGIHSVTLAAVSAYGGAALASIVPAWRATRVRPLDAMAPRSGAAGPGKFPLGTMVPALALLAVNPVLAFAFPPRFDGEVVPRLAAGFLAMAAGFVLIAPAVVAFVDRVVGPVLARALGIEPRLLASQVSSHLWRTAGAAMSMTVGLGLFVAIQVWAFTMLGAFVPGKWAPDAVAIMGPGGLAPEKAADFARIPGVDPERCAPVVVEQPRLLEDITGSAERASIIRQGNVVIAGMDPRRAFGGARPLFEFEWVAGSPADAVREMEAGRGCVVPDHFLRETKLKLGDSFAVVPPEDPKHPVSYKIAGAVRLPGWHWQTKQIDFRFRNHRAAALVFANYDVVAKDFGLKQASHVWFSYAPGGRADPERIAAEAGKLRGPAPAGEEAVGQPAGERPGVRVVPVEGIRRMTVQAAARWIWVARILTLLTLLVACFGVLNVMIAAVRARQWDMGVLRAIGFTRWTLVRAVIAEGLLVGFVACVLSVGLGTLAGWCGCEYSQYISFFGGLYPDLVIPWPAVAVGVILALALAGLAALWPAVSIGRAKPLALLQQGRGAL